MTLTQWALFFLLVQCIHFLGTWKLYKTAGYAPWKAIVPVYNAIVLMKIIKRPLWWVILLFIPTINLIMVGVIWVETIRSFGKNSWKDTLLVLGTLGFYIFTINYAKGIRYIEDRSVKARTALGETISSIVFAVVAATIVHNYFIQPYIIPSGSLEKSLLIGDFLFVSKFHYGARAPMTAVSFPMVHDTIPLVKVRSYLKKPQIPYFRLPKLTTIKRNDIVVFSWPADTVRQFFVSEKRVDKPIDKKSNYVKRCVGLPGDTLEIINGFVHTNGEKNKLPNRAKVQYAFTAYGKKGISSRKLLDLGYENFTRKYKIQNLTQESYQKLVNRIIGITGNQSEGFEVTTGAKGLTAKHIAGLGLQAKELVEATKRMTLTVKEAEKLEALPWIDSVKQRITAVKTPNETFFPNRIPYDWNEDNFGPLVIPKKGTRIALTPENFPLYKKIIVDYEKNALQTTADTFIINGKETHTYTFQKDYYWMMGDNRHQSEDSRFWGFVPDDHIVGKPIFIWFSIKGINQGLKNWRIRWDRIFTTVNGPGEPLSYFPYFIGLIVLWRGYIIYKRRRKLKV